MIVLVCKYCGNKDLKPNVVYYETTCIDCNRSLCLWEMQAIHIPNGRMLLQADPHELKEQNTMQLGVK